MSSEPSAETVAVTKVLTGEKNERGIPKVVFIVRGGAPPPPPPAAGAPADPRARVPQESVETLLKKHSIKIDVVLEALQQLHRSESQPPPRIAAPASLRARPRPRAASTASWRQT